MGESHDFLSCNLGLQERELNHLWLVLHSYLDALQGLFNELLHGQNWKYLFYSVTALICWKKNGPRGHLSPSAILQILTFPMSGAMAHWHWRSKKNITITPVFLGLWPSDKGGPKKVSPWRSGYNDTLTLGIVFKPTLSLLDFTHAKTENSHAKHSQY